MPRSLSWINDVVPRSTAEARRVRLRVPRKAAPGPSGFVGWDPPWSTQQDLHRQLWNITRITMCNYLAEASCQVKAPVSGNGE